LRPKDGTAASGIASCDDGVRADVVELKVDIAEQLLQFEEALWIA
jgi:hypothetical protein